MSDAEFWKSTPRKLMFMAHQYQKHDPNKPKVLKGDDAIKDLLGVIKR